MVVGLLAVEARARACVCVWGGRVCSCVRVCACACVHLVFYGCVYVCVCVCGLCCSGWETRDAYALMSAALCAFTATSRAPVLVVVETAGALDAISDVAVVSLGVSSMNVFIAVICGAITAPIPAGNSTKRMHVSTHITVLLWVLHAAAAPRDAMRTAVGIEAGTGRFPLYLHGTPGCRAHSETSNAHQFWLMCAAVACMTWHCMATHLGHAWLHTRERFNIERCLPHKTYAWTAPALLVTLIRVISEAATTLQEVHNSIVRVSKCST